MRTRYTLINMLVNIGGQFFTMLLSFINRMVFIHCLSAAYLGVNGLFTDVLCILNFAELGIGTAMVFSMYEPAARDDEKKLARLMNLYKWMYRAVAASVLLFGLVLLPFLPYLIKGGEGIEHITLIYMIYVLGSASSYLLNYKSSIYQAYQKGYIRAGWNMVCEFIKTVLQIAILLLTGNFILYLVVQQAVQFLPNIMVSRRVDKEFPYLKECRELPDREERNGILKNIGAMSMHKLAIVIVRNTDSLLMSSFIGLTTVGLYSNYRLVINALNNLMTKVVTAFSGSVGNFAALENSDRLYQVYKEMDFLFFVLSGYLTGGLMMLFNSLIALLFGEEYCFPMATVVFIVTEFYITRMRQTNLLFREVMGLFWNDRYKAVAESVINLVVSLVLVQRYGVTGIIGGTIISTLCTCTWIEPYIFLKYGVREDWQQKYRAYFAEYLKRLLLTAAVSAAAVLWVQRFPVGNFCIFILDGLLYTAVFAGVIVLFYRGSAEYAALKQRGLELLKRNKEYT